MESKAEVQIIHHSFFQTLVILPLDAGNHLRLFEHPLPYFERTI
jgi:hypothetical protein